jgi:uncharacterized protein with HEPN domain
MSFEEFNKDRKTVDASLMQLEHIWETVKKINKNYPKFDILPSREISWLRDIIAHDYLWIDNYEIRDTIQDDLPQIKKILLNYIENFKS